jgi:hypothetical protein
VSDDGAASCAELDGGKFCVNVLKAAPSLLDFTSLFDHLASCTATFNLLLLSLTVRVWFQSARAADRSLPSLDASRESPSPRFLLRRVATRKVERALLPSHALDPAQVLPHSSVAHHIQ